MLVKYANWFKVNILLHFYNVYGPQEISSGKYATVIGKFLELKKQNASYLPITKPGTQKRRFTHIDDIINGLILVGKKGLGDNFGIGANKSYSIIEIADILNMQYKLTAQKKGNRLGASLKTSKTKNLGWKSTKSLRKYLLDESQQN